MGASLAGAVAIGLAGSVCGTAEDCEVAAVSTAGTVLSPAEVVKYFGPWMAAIASTAIVRIDPRTMYTARLLLPGVTADSGVSGKR